MIKAFPLNYIDPYIICPKNGNVADIFLKNNLKVFRSVGISYFDHSIASYYRGVRWFVLIREFSYIFFNLLDLYKVHKKWGPFDIIHINEIGMLLSAFVEKLFGKTHIIIHVRSTQETKKGIIRKKIIEKIINYTASQIIAIDRDVASTLENIKNINIIHNGTFINNTIIAETNNKEYDFKDENEIPKTNVVVAFIGGLIVIKGIFDFFEAAKICLKDKRNITFLIVGENSFDKEIMKTIKGKILIQLGLINNIEMKLKELIDEYGIKSNVVMTGFISDIKKVFSSIDVLCFPGYCEAIGRPVFEAGINGIPSIVTLTNPISDVVIDKYNGLIVPPHSTKILANKILELVNNEEMRKNLIL